MEATNIKGFVEVLQAYWWMFLIIAGIISYIVKVALEIQAHKARIATIEKLQNYLQEDVRYLLRSSFANLDGLKQLNCNGRVTKMYDEMRLFVLNEHNRDAE